MSGKNMVVEVTPKEIEDAIPENSASCMVAMAIKAKYPGAGHVHVDLQTIRFTDRDGNRRTYLTPGKAQVALVRFDAGDPVDPFSFRLVDPIHIRTKNKIKGKLQHDSKGGPLVETGGSTVQVHPDKERGRVTLTRVGGHPVPTSTALGAATRRKFGIRGLRINQAGQATHMDGAATDG